MKNNLIKLFKILLAVLGFARIVQIEDGRGWYSGTFEASADVTMIKK